jgi:flagellar motility protein MotE (MotC chaperone)
MSRPASHRTYRGGTLFLISVLMLGSATLRLGAQVRPAAGREMSQLAPEEARQQHESPPTAATPEELQRVLAAFQGREKRLAAREVQISDRMKALEIADAALERKIAALVAAEENLRATLAMADGASESDLTQLTDVYEKMKPKESAEIFEEMNPGFAAGFLARMRPDAAAGIMSALSPTAAYSISVVLAGRNAEVPKN